MALRCSLAGYLVCALFDSRVVAEDLWMLIGMSCCLANVSAHMAATADRRAELAEGVGDRPRQRVRRLPGIAHDAMPHTT